jgi:hypothetical protein
VSNSFSITEYKKELFEQGLFDFNRLAGKALLFQLSENEVFNKFFSSLNHRVQKTGSYLEYPFLPIRFYKTNPVLSEKEIPAVFFESSGTTGQERSRHYLSDSFLYEKSLTLGFEKFFGPVEEWQILALLPGYLEQPHSSLVYMMRHLMRYTKTGRENFYLHQYDALFHHIERSEEEGIKTMLVGVTHALLDFVEQYPIQLKHTHVLETGGMKGRRKEMLREEVHAILKERFSIKQVFSEYGMTELLSQAYSLKDGVFNCPPWMKVLVRDEDDPLQIKEIGRGAINIIDLVNIHSCCFIATDDVGEVYEDGSFRILGRLDQSEWRGCSLMAV